MTESPFLMVHAIEKVSATNGPGLRTVIWTQGCSLACPGCFNPETHPVTGGSPLDPVAWIEDLRAHATEIEGVTISGGEPFQQPAALLSLLRTIRAQTNLSTILFSGYTQDEIAKIRFSTEILSQVDVLIAGRYRAELRTASGLIGSSNKNLMFLTGRYSIQDFSALPEAEVWIRPDGNIQLSGIDPIAW